MCVENDIHVFRIHISSGFSCLPSTMFDELRIGPAISVILMNFECIFHSSSDKCPTRRTYYVCHPKPIDERILILLHFALSLPHLHGK